MAGCTVTVAGRTVATLEETVAMITEAGGAARHVQCDVSDEQSVADAVRVAVGDSGRLDFGVNSAGISGNFTAHGAATLRRAHASHQREDHHDHAT